MTDLARVAVVCAVSPFNAGMYSVDMAALDFFKGFKGKVDLFVAQAIPRPKAFILIPSLVKYTTPPRVYNHGRLSAQLLSSISQLSFYDVIIYWGDFLNNPVYGDSDFSNRDQRWGYSKSRRDAFARWKSLFCGEGIKDKKIISAGNNFQNEFERQSHLDALQSIFQNFNYIFPRDQYSTSNIAKHRPDCSRARLTCGLDMAFLQDPQPREPAGMFSYFFFRSKLSHSERLICGLQKMTNQRGFLLKNWLRLSILWPNKSFNRLREQLAKSSFVVTDTYHVAVNAMNLGVPVFCVGRPSVSQKGTLGDFKKLELFKAFGLEQCYFQSENEASDMELSEFLPKTISAAHADGFPEFRSAYHKLREKQDGFRRKLWGAIDS